MKRAILVLGAQRSGTSVTSHVLSELGVQFGDRDRFIQFDHNPIFFELKWVNELNNQIVQAIGHQYIDFFLPLESDFMAAEVQPKIQAIQTQLDRLIESEWKDDRTEAESLIIGIKDPRISLTFSVWEPVLLSRGYAIQLVHAFRSPIGFLQSNQKLFYQWKGWTIERHLRFWLQLNLAAIYFTRHHSVHLLNYDSLMQFPLTEVAQLVSALSLDSFLITQAASVIQSEHYHCGDRSQNIQLDISWMNGWVKDIYLKLCAKTVSPDDYLCYRQQMRSALTV